MRRLRPYRGRPQITRRVLLHLEAQRLRVNINNQEDYRRSAIGLVDQTKQDMFCVHVFLTSAPSFSERDGHGSAALSVNRSYMLQLPTRRCTWRSGKSDRTLSKSGIPKPQIDPVYSFDRRMSKVRSYRFMCYIPRPRGSADPAGTG